MSCLAFRACSKDLFDVYAKGSIYTELPLEEVCATRVGTAVCSTAAILFIGDLDTLFAFVWLVLFEDCFILESTVLLLTPYFAISALA